MKTLTKHSLSALLSAAALLMTSGFAMADNTVSLSYGNNDFSGAGITGTYEGYVLESEGQYDNGVAYGIDYTNIDDRGLDLESGNVNTRALLAGTNFGVAADYRWAEMNGTASYYHGLGVAFGLEEAAYGVDARLTTDVDEFADEYAFAIDGSYDLGYGVDLVAGYDYLNMDEEKHEYSVGAQYAIGNGALIKGEYTRVEVDTTDVDRFNLGVGFAF